MKFNNSVHFEISSDEVKDIIFGLAKGFVKVQQWKAEAERDADRKTKMGRRMKPIAEKFRKDLKRDMDRFDANLKRDMDAFNRKHQRNLKGIRALSDDIDKKTNAINLKCRKTNGIDVSTLPDEIKRQIALDYIKKHPLSEEQQKQVADEYIRKYGVIK
nr:hypothetical protein [Catenibacterium mitsuokai]